MLKHISQITLLVDEIDRALEFYVGVLGFVKRSDIVHESGFRYVTVAPSLDGPDLWLLPATTDRQEARIGNQTDDVAMTIATDDCRSDYTRLDALGVVFHGEPEVMPWGTEVVLEDLYGNRFVLVEHR